ncbi:MAG: hypothetical protein GY858_02190 [Candidatus Omnitrophica bacterium]|nr:hypothetical protein [Candidatus Omnitrophota bacterium]
MIIFLEKKKASISFKSVAILVIVTFLASSFGVYLSKTNTSYASVLPYMPLPNKIIGTTPKFTPPLLRGVKFYPDNLMQFDFIIDEGDLTYSEKLMQIKASRMMKYFLAALTIPEEDLWVNLSPYERHTIVPHELGLTDMGRDLLGEDYILKQLLASLTYPDSELGKKFWDKIYKRAFDLYGTTNIPINTFNKIWIVPDKIILYEDANRAIIGKSRLKVMLEEDYLALRKNSTNSKIETNKLSLEEVSQISNFSSKVMKEVILPVIEEEINGGESFTYLRQIYNSLILATWFKKKLKDTVLGQIYVDKGKIKGAETEDPRIKEKIYNQYLEAYRKGLYNYKKTDFDAYLKRQVQRQYYSGGFDGTEVGGRISRGLRRLKKMVGDRAFKKVSKMVVSPTGPDAVSVKPSGQAGLGEEITEETKVGAVRPGPGKVAGVAADAGLADAEMALGIPPGEGLAFSSNLTKLQIALNGYRKKGIKIDEAFLEKELSAIPESHRDALRKFTLTNYGDLFMPDAGQAGLDAEITEDTRVGAVRPGPGKGTGAGAGQISNGFSESEQGIQELNQINRRQESLDSREQAELKVMTLAQIAYGLTLNPLARSRIWLMARQGKLAELTQLTNRLIDKSKKLGSGTIASANSQEGAISYRKALRRAVSFIVEADIQEFAAFVNGQPSAIQGQEKYHLGEGNAAKETIALIDGLLDSNSTFRKNPKLLAEIITHEALEAVSWDATHQDLYTGIQRSIFGSKNKVRAALRTYINTQVDMREDVAREVGDELRMNLDKELIGVLGIENLIAWVEQREQLFLVRDIATKRKGRAVSSVTDEGADQQKEIHQQLQSRKREFRADALAQLGVETDAIVSLARAGKVTSEQFQRVVELSAHNFDDAMGLLRDFSEVIENDGLQYLFELAEKSKGFELAVFFANQPAKKAEDKIQWVAGHKDLIDKYGIEKLILLVRGSGCGGSLGASSRDVFEFLQNHQDEIDNHGIENVALATYAQLANIYNIKFGKHGIDSGLEMLESIELRAKEAQTAKEDQESESDSDGIIAHRWETIKFTDFKDNLFNTERDAEKRYSSAQGLLEEHGLDKILLLTEHSLGRGIGNIKKFESLIKKIGIDLLIDLGADFPGGRDLLLEALSNLYDYQEMSDLVVPDPNKTLNNLQRLIQEFSDLCTKLGSNREGVIRSIRIFSPVIVAGDIEVTLRRLSLINDELIKLDQVAQAQGFESRKDETLYDSLADLKDIVASGDDINQTVQKIREIGRDLISLGSSAGSKVSFAFAKNMYKIFHSFEDGFVEDNWDLFMRLAMVAGKQTELLFGEVLGELKGPISSRQDLIQLVDFFEKEGMVDKDFFTDFLSLSSDERIRYLQVRDKKHSDVVMGRVIFDPNNHDHVLFGYKMLREAIENHPTVKKIISYKQYRKFLKNPKSLGGFSKKEQNEIRYLVYEAFKVRTFLDTLRSRVSAIDGHSDRPIAVVENLTYGWMAMLPIEDDLESRGIKLIRTKSGSTYSHTHPLAMHGKDPAAPDDADLFSDQDLEFIVQNNPYVMVVDGSYSLDPERTAAMNRKDARFSDGLQAYFHYFQAISRHQRDRDFGIDGVTTQDGVPLSEQLKQYDIYQEVRQKAEAIAARLGVELPDYEGFYWYPGRQKPKVSRERVLVDIPEERVLFNSNDPEKPFMNKVTRPAVILTLANMEDTAIPIEDKRRLELEWEYHNSAHLDDTEPFEQAFMMLSDRGPTVSEGFTQAVKDEKERVARMLDVDLSEDEGVRDVNNFEVEAVIADFDDTLVPYPDSIRDHPAVLTNLAALLEIKPVAIITEETEGNMKHRLWQHIPENLRSNLFIYSNGGTRGFTFDRAGNKVSLFSYTVSSREKERILQVVSDTVPANVYRGIARGYKVKLEVSKEEKKNKVQYARKLVDAFAKAGIDAVVSFQGSRHINIYLKDKVFAARDFSQRTSISLGNSLVLANSVGLFGGDRGLFDALDSSLRINVGSSRDGIISDRVYHFHRRGFGVASQIIGRVVSGQGAIDLNEIEYRPPKSDHPSAEYYAVNAFEALRLKGDKDRVNPGNEKKARSKVSRKPISGAKIDGKDVFQMTEVDRQQLIDTKAFGTNGEELGELVKEAYSIVESWGFNMGRIKDKEKVLIAVVSSSWHMFEDCEENDFVAINKDFLALARKNPKIAKIMFIVGLAHELRHEAGEAIEHLELDVALMAELLEREGLAVRGLREALEGYFISDEFIDTVEGLQGKVSPMTKILAKNGARNEADIRKRFGQIAENAKKAKTRRDAERVLGRTLTEDEHEAVWKAHQIPIPDAEEAKKDIKEAQARRRALKEKREILEAAGFERDYKKDGGDEIVRLMDEAVVGQDVTPKKEAQNIAAGFADPRMAMVSEKRLQMAAMQKKAIAEKRDQLANGIIAQITAQDWWEYRENTLERAAGDSSPVAAAIAQGIAGAIEKYRKGDYGFLEESILTEIIDAKFGNMPANVKELIDIGVAAESGRVKKVYDFMQKTMAMGATKKGRKKYAVRALKKAIEKLSVDGLVEIGTEKSVTGDKVNGHWCTLGTSGESAIYVNIGGKDSGGELIDVQASEIYARVKGRYSEYRRTQKVKSGEETPQQRGELLNIVLDHIREEVPYRKEFSYEKMLGRVLLVGDVIGKEKGGVCRHMALLAAGIFEKLIEEEKLGGKVYYSRGKGHAWMIYQTSDDRFYVLDAAQDKSKLVDINTKYFGREKDGKGMTESYAEAIRRYRPDINIDGDNQESKEAVGTVIGKNVIFDKELLKIAKRVRKKIVQARRLLGDDESYQQTGDALRDAGEKDNIIIEWLESAKNIKGMLKYKREIFKRNSGVIEKVLDRIIAENKFGVIGRKPMAPKKLIDVAKDEGGMISRAMSELKKGLISSGVQERVRNMLGNVLARIARNDGETTHIVDQGDDLANAAALGYKLGAVFGLDDGINKLLKKAALGKATPKEAEVIEEAVLAAARGDRFIDLINSIRKGDDPVARLGQDDEAYLRFDNFVLFQAGRLIYKVWTDGKEVKIQAQKSGAKVASIAPSLSLEEGDSFFVGRDPDEVDYAITDDRYLSRKHLSLAVVELDSGGYILQIIQHSTTQETIIPRQQEDVAVNFVSKEEVVPFQALEIVNGKELTDQKVKDIKEQAKKDAKPIAGANLKTDQGEDVFAMTSAQQVRLEGLFKRLGMADAAAGSLIQKALDRLKEDQAEIPDFNPAALTDNQILTAILPKGSSKHLFANCKEDNFIGIGEEFFEIVAAVEEEYDKETAAAFVCVIFPLGIGHEARHEGGAKGEHLDLDAAFALDLIAGEEHLTITQFANILNLPKVTALLDSTALVAAMIGRGVTPKKGITRKDDRKVADNETKIIPVRARTKRGASLYELDPEQIKEETANAEEILNYLMLEKPQFLDECLRNLNLARPIEEMDISFYGFGVSKRTFRIDAQCNGKRRTILMALDSDRDGEGTFYMDGELEMQQDLQGTGYVPDLGGVLYIEKKENGSYGQVGWERDDLMGKHYTVVSLQELIKGPTVGQMTEKLTNEETDAAEYMGNRINMAQAREMYLEALIGSVLEVNGTTLENFRAPSDVHSDNVVVDASLVWVIRLVLVDLGLVVNYANMKNFLFDALSLYIDAKTKRMILDRNGDVLNYLYEKWPQHSETWDANLNRLVTELTNLSNDLRAAKKKKVFINDFEVLAVDVKRVAGGVSAFLKNNRPQVLGSNLGNDLEPLAIRGLDLDPMIGSTEGVNGVIDTVSRRINQKGSVDFEDGEEIVAELKRWAQEENANESYIANLSAAIDILERSGQDRYRELIEILKSYSFPAIAISEQDHSTLPPKITEFFETIPFMQGIGDLVDQIIESDNAPQKMTLVKRLWKELAVSSVVADFRGYGRLLKGHFDRLEQFGEEGDRQAIDETVSQIKQVIDFVGQPHYYKILEGQLIILNETINKGVAESVEEEADKLRSYLNYLIVLERNFDKSKGIDLVVAKLVGARDIAHDIANSTAGLVMTLEWHLSEINGTSEKKRNLIARNEELSERWKMLLYICYNLEGVNADVIAVELFSELKIYLDDFVDLVETANIYFTEVGYKDVAEFRKDMEDVKRYPMRLKKFIDKLGKRPTGAVSVLSAINNAKQLLKNKMFDIHISKIKEDTEIYANPDKLEMLIKCMITNAYQARDKGRNEPPAIWFTTELVEEDGQIYTVLRVRDNGKGIDAKNLPDGRLNSIFADGVTSGKEGGTGVGLDFVKKSLESFGGVVKVESQVGVGTVFSLYFRQPEEGVLASEEDDAVDIEPSPKKDRLDVNVADIGVRAGPHSRVNQMIREAFIHDEVEFITDLKGNKICLIGSGSDMYLDEDTGQTAHIGIGRGVIYIASGAYDKCEKEGSLEGLITRESVVLRRWRQEADRRGIAYDRMRGWIQDNLQEAEILDEQFHEAAEKVSSIMSIKQDIAEVRNAKGSREIFDFCISHLRKRGFLDETEDSAGNTIIKIKTDTDAARSDPVAVSMQRRLFNVDEGDEGAIVFKANAVWAIVGFDFEFELNEDVLADAQRDIYYAERGYSLGQTFNSRPIREREIAVRTIFNRVKKESPEIVFLGESLKAKLPGRIYERALDGLKRGETVEDVDEMFLGYAGVQSRMLKGSEAETARDDGLIALEDKVKGFIRKLGFSYQAIRRASVPQENIPESLPGAQAFYFNLYDIVGIAEGSIADLQIFYEIFIHEFFHSQCYGFAPHVLNEAATEYVTLKFLMRQQGKDVFTFDELKEFMDRRAARDIEKGIGASAYYWEVLAMKRLIDVIGEAPVLEAYFTGKKNALKDALGNQWQELVDLAYEYKNLEKDEEFYNTFAAIADQAKTQGDGAEVINAASMFGRRRGVVKVQPSPKGVTKIRSKEVISLAKDDLSAVAFPASSKVGENPLTFNIRGAQVIDYDGGARSVGRDRALRIVNGALKELESSGASYSINRIIVSDEGPLAEAYIDESEETIVYVNWMLLVTRKNSVRKLFWEIQHEFYHLMVGEAFMRHIKKEITKKGGLFENELEDAVVEKLIQEGEVIVRSIQFMLNGTEGLGIDEAIEDHQELEGLARSHHDKNLSADISAMRILYEVIREAGSLSEETLQYVIERILIEKTSKELIDRVLQTTETVDRDAFRDRVNQRIKKGAKDEIKKRTGVSLSDTRDQIGKFSGIETLKVVDGQLTGTITHTEDPDITITFDKDNSSRAPPSEVAGYTKAVNDYLDSLPPSQARQKAKELVKKFNLEDVFITNEGAKGFFGAGKKTFAVIDQDVISNPISFLHEIIEHQKHNDSDLIAELEGLLDATGKKWLADRIEKYKRLGDLDYFIANRKHYVIRAFTYQLDPEGDVLLSQDIRARQAKPKSTSRLRRFFIAATLAVPLFLGACMSAFQAQKPAQDPRAFVSQATQMENVDEKVSVLTDLLINGNDRVSEIAAYDLRLLSSKDITAKIIEIIGDDSKPPLVRRRAMGALAVSKIEHVDVLIGLLKHQDDFVCKEAANFLGRIGLRYAFMERGEEYNRRFGPPLDRAIEALVRLLDDNDDRIVAAAVDALGAFTYVQAARGALCNFLEKHKEVAGSVKLYVRRSAVKALGQMDIATDEVIALLFDLYQNEANYGILRKEAAIALANLSMKLDRGDFNAVAKKHLLPTFLQSSEKDSYGGIIALSRIYSKAGSWLSQHEKKTILNFVADFIRYKESPVVIGTDIIETLVEIGDDALPLMLSFLDVKRPDVSLKIGQALVAKGGSVVPGLLRALEQNKNDNREELAIILTGITNELEDEEAEQMDPLILYLASQAQAIFNKALVPNDFRTAYNSWALNQAMSERGLDQVHKVFLARAIYNILERFNLDVKEEYIEKIVPIIVQLRTSEKYLNKEIIKKGSSLITGSNSEDGFEVDEIVNLVAEHGGNLIATFKGKKERKGFLKKIKRLSFNPNNNIVWFNGHGLKGELVFGGGFRNTISAEKLADAFIARAQKLKGKHKGMLSDTVAVLDKCFSTDSAIKFYNHLLLSLLNGEIKDLPIIIASANRGTFSFGYSIPMPDDLGNVGSVMVDLIREVSGNKGPFSIEELDDQGNVKKWKPLGPVTIGVLHEAEIKMIKYQDLTIFWPDVEIIKKIRDALGITDGGFRKTSAEDNMGESPFPTDYISLSGDDNDAVTNRQEKQKIELSPKAGVIDFMGKFSGIENLKVVNGRLIGTITHLETGEKITFDESNSYRAVPEEIIAKYQELKDLAKLLPDGEEKAFMDQMLNHFHVELANWLTQIYGTNSNDPAKDQRTAEFAESAYLNLPRPDEVKHRSRGEISSDIAVINERIKTLQAKKTDGTFSDSDRDELNKLDNDLVQKRNELIGALHATPSHRPVDDPKHIIITDVGGKGFFGVAGDDFIAIDESVFDNPFSLGHELTERYKKTTKGKYIMDHIDNIIHSGDMIGAQWLADKEREYIDSGRRSYFEANIDHYMIRALFYQIAQLLKETKGVDLDEQLIRDIRKAQGKPPYTRAVGADSGGSGESGASGPGGIDLDLSGAGMQIIDGKINIPSQGVTIDLDDFKGFTFQIISIKVIRNLDEILNIS